MIQILEAVPQARTVPVDDDARLGISLHFLKGLLDFLLAIFISKFSGRKEMFRAHPLPS